MKLHRLAALFCATTLLISAGCSDDKSSSSEPEGEPEGSSDTAEPAADGAAEPEATEDTAEPEATEDTTEPEMGDMAEPEMGDMAEPETGDAEPEMGDMAEPEMGDAEPEMGDMAEADADEDAEPEAPPTLYEQLGGWPGISAAVDGFLDVVAADARINGYFLNSSVDLGNTGWCLKQQFSNLTGSPDHAYPAEGDGSMEFEVDGTTYTCRDMTSAHAGMGVSQQDFDDLVEDLVTVLGDAGVDPAVQAVIEGALAGFVPVIVSDVDNDDTVYQRVGRKPAISAVVGAAYAAIAADAAINGFFGGDAARLATCLTRQVCSIDGPCKYGEGVEAELMVGEDLVPCMDMASVHAGMTNPGNADAAITIDDFNAVAGHFATAMDDAGVAEADRDAVIGVLASMCADIVAGGMGCE